MWAKQGSRGFTIVELLIVIVVIAILAAITIVAFNGIQSRAADSSAQQDLATFHKKVALFHADNGFYPRDATDLVNNIRMPFTKSAYVLNDGNFMYCASTGGASYNALQQLTYAGVVFILAPLSVITGLALSPALVAKYPGFLKLFGDRRQVARSLHFIAMVLFS